MKKQIGTVLVLGSLLAAACNFGGQPEPEAEEPVLEAPVDEAPEEPELEPTEAPEEEVEVPKGPPIEHLDPETLILVTHIQMISQERGWGIGGLDGRSDHVFRTSDGGATWLDVTPPEPAPVEGDPAKAAVGYFISPMSGWVVFYESSLEPNPVSFQVWSTSDGGESWQASNGIDLEFLGTTDHPPILGFEDEENGWLIARHGPAGMHNYPVYVLRTNNGGQRWEMAITPAEGGLQNCRKSGVDFGNLMTGWVTVADCPVVAPEVAVTHDGGRNWEPLMLPAPDSRPDLFETELCEGHSPQLISDMVGAVAVSCRTGLKLNYIYTTQDGGETWESHLYPGGQLELLNPRTAYAFDRHIFETLDGGVTWDHVKTVQWDGQFSFVNDQVGWAVARQGDALALVTTTNGGRTWDLLKPSITS